MRTNAGWKKLEHIVICSVHLALVTADNRVHLIAELNETEWAKSQSGHYSMPVSAIIGSVYAADDDDEKKCTECDEWQIRYNALKLQLEQMENEKNEYVQKYNDAMEECKETKMEMFKIQQELKELKRLHLDPADYLKWSSDDVVDYLCTLDDGKYEKYSAKLRSIFVEENVNGEVLHHIDKPSLRDWGVSDFGDRSKIYNHLQKIVNRNIDKKHDVNENGNE